MMNFKMCVCFFLHIFGGLRLIVVIPIVILGENGSNFKHHRAKTRDNSQETSS